MMPPTTTEPLTIAQRAQVRWFGLAITVITLLAYSNSFSGAFALDDQSTILENPSIRSLWPLNHVFTPPTLAGTGGRPIANLTFALDHALSGTAVWSYHLTNLLLHIATALVLFGVVRRTLEQARVPARLRVDAVALAAIAAALWAVHPLTTAAVDYISQRTEQLLALFYLFSLYGFVRGVSSGAPAWLAFSVSSCAIGMGCKEVMVTAPAMIALYDRTFVAGSFRAAWRVRWKYYLGLAATWAVLATLMIVSRVGERGVGFGAGVSTWTYALTECRALALYLKLALWPQPLVFDYGWAFVRHAATIWPQALVVGALLTATTLALWRRPVAGFIGGWFFVVLAPTSSFVPVLHQPIAESRMYLPLAGLIAGGVAAAHLAASRRVNAPRLAVLVALALLVLARNAIYRDPLTLWRDTLAKQPLNARAHNNLASTLLDLKRHAEALPHALEAARLQPRYADAQVNIGAALAAAGRIAEAAEHYRTAIAFDPNYATGHANLGNALLLLGRPAEAQPHLETAIHLNPDLAQPHNDLGVLLLDAGRYEDSLVHEEIAVRLAPNEPNGHYNLGNACARLRRYPEAIAAYQNALRLKPDFAKAHNNLGVVLLLSGRAAEAVPCFEAALRYNPSHPEAPRNLEAARRAAQR